MAKKRGQDLAVGAVFALALIVVGMTVMAVGEETRLFSRKTPFVVRFPNTEGLAVGSPVKMDGVQVGTVLAIRLPTDPGQAGIEVTLGVDDAYAQRVRDDSLARLEVLQYLTGEKAVAITPGSAEHPALPGGSTIALEQSTELLEQVGVVSQNLAEITVSLKNVLGALERGEGLVGQMINDPEFGKEGLEALKGSFQNLQAITESVLEGKGVVGRLVGDDSFADKLDSLGEALDGIAALVASVDLDKGAVGELFREVGDAQLAMHDLRETAASLRRVSAGLEGRDSVLGRFLNDPQYADSITTDFQSILHNAAEITDKINRGEGTLGALVNDRTMHDGLEDVIAGVNDSKFARWLLRHYQKNGIKSESSEAGGQDEEGEP